MNPLIDLDQITRKQAELEPYLHTLSGRIVADAVAEAYQIDPKCVDIMMRIISPEQYMNMQIFLATEKQKLKEYILSKTEQVDNWKRNKRGVQWICLDCGNKYGHRPVGLATWHEDICDICGKKTGVTEPRDFGGLKIDRRLS